MKFVLFYLICVVYGQIPTLTVTQNARIGSATNSDTLHNAAYVDQARGVRYSLGVFQNIAQYDVVIEKFNVSTQQLIWNTTLGSGPTASTYGYGISGQPNGNILITGTTNGNLNNVTRQGGTDIFLVKMSPDGVIIFTNLIGTAKDEYIGDTIDNTCIAYDAVNGLTWLFGTTYGAFPGFSKIGTTDTDAFLAAVNDSGNTVLIEQFGGSFIEYANSVVLVGTRITLFGNTFSPDFPVTANAQQPTRKDINSDAYIRSYDFTSNTLTLSYSTYFNPAPTPSYPGLGSVSADANGDYYALFARKSILKFDVNYNIIWNTSFDSKRMEHAHYIPALKVVTTSDLFVFSILDSDSGTLLTSLNTRNYTDQFYFSFYSAASYVIDANNFFIYPIATIYGYLRQPIGVQYTPSTGGLQTSISVFEISAKLNAVTTGFNYAGSYLTTGRVTASTLTSGRLTSPTTSRLTSGRLTTNRLTTGRIMVTTSQLTTGSATIIGTSCFIDREQKCLTNTTYTTCTNGKYSASQSCNVNLVCRPTKTNTIFCVEPEPSITGSVVGTSCSVDREQRCLTTNTYATCTNGYFSKPQSCQPGLVCSPGINPGTIYCT